MPAAVTVGIPFFNAERYLADAVRSVFAQTFAAWELILVDDGSTDGSLEIVRQIDDPRVLVLSDGMNRGLCARLNQIAGLAHAELLARMDADDLMHPERLARQVEFLEANRRVDVVDTTTYTIGEDNSLLGIRGDQPLRCDVADVLRRGLFIHPTVMGRTSWFRARPYDGDFFRAEDHELWLRTCRTSVFERLRMPLFFYRESLSGNLKNYLASACTVRKIISHYGPATVGRFETAALLVRSHLKTWSYWTSTQLGWQDWLIRNRNRLLDANEVHEGQLALRTVLETAVSGMNPFSNRCDSPRSAS